MKKILFIFVILFVAIHINSKTMYQQHVRKVVIQDGCYLCQNITYKNNKFYYIKFFGSDSKNKRDVVYNVFGCTIHEVFQKCNNDRYEIKGYIDQENNVGVFKN